MRRYKACKTARKSRSPYNHNLAHHNHLASAYSESPAYCNCSDPIQMTWRTSVWLDNMRSIITRSIDQLVTWSISIICNACYCPYSDSISRAQTVLKCSKNLIIQMVVLLWSLLLHRGDTTFTTLVWMLAHYSERQSENKYITISANCIRMLKDCLWLKCKSSSWSNSFHYLYWRNYKSATNSR